MAGRPLYTVTAYQNEYPLSIFSTTAPGTLVFSFALNKNFLPKHDVGSKLGVRISAKVLHPNLGLHVYVRIGGTRTGADGIASPEGILTLTGLNSTGRLEVDISSLYSGGTTEWCKLFAYVDSGGAGGTPIIDTQTIVISGDEPPQLPSRPRVPRPPADLDLGVDIDVVTDLPPSFVLASGLRNLGNAIARRLDTPRGALEAIDDDPDYGYDLRGKLNADLTTSEIDAIASEVEAECLKDPRIQQATVTQTYSLGNYQLAVDISLLTTAGPYTLILGIGTLSVDVLSLQVAAT